MSPSGRIQCKPAGRNPIPPGWRYL